MEPCDLRPHDPDTWDPETRVSGTRDPDTQDPWNWDLHTQDPVNGSLGLGNCDTETQNPESRTLRNGLVTQIPSIPTRTTD